MNEKIGRLTIGQMKKVLELWETPGQKGFADGKKEGSIMRTLHDQGFISPAGRDGVRTQWSVNNEALDIDSILLMKRSIILFDENKVKQEARR